MKRAGIGALLVFVLFSFPQTALSHDPEADVSTRVALERHAFIECERRSPAGASSQRGFCGSGVDIGDGYVLTALHVVDDANGIWADGKPAFVRAKHLPYDLALLSVAGRQKMLPLRFDFAPALGKDIVVAGSFILGGWEEESKITLMIMKANIAAVGPGEIFLGGKIVPVLGLRLIYFFPVIPGGFSGGGLYRNGLFVGLSRFKQRDSTLQYVFSGAIAADTVRIFLERNGWRRDGDKMLPPVVLKK